MIPNHPISQLRVHPYQVSSSTASASKTPKQSKCPSLTTDKQGSIDSIATSVWKPGHTPQSEWWLFNEQNVATGCLYIQHKNWRLSSTHLVSESNKHVEIDQQYFVTRGQIGIYYKNKSHKKCGANQPTTKHLTSGNGHTNQSHWLWSSGSVLG